MGVITVNIYGVLAVRVKTPCVKTKSTSLYRSPDLLNRPHALVNSTPIMLFISCEPDTVKCMDFHVHGSFFKLWTAPHSIREGGVPSSIYSKVGSAFSTLKGSFCLEKVVVLRYQPGFACIGVVAVLRTQSVYVVPQSYIAPETALSSAYHTGFTFEFGKLIL